MPPLPGSGRKRRRRRRSHDRALFQPLVPLSGGFRGGKGAESDLPPWQRRWDAVPGAYLTSCGTESDNWAVRAAAEYGKRKGKHIITTAIEHHAVLNPVAELEREGYEVTYLQPTDQGTVDLAELERALRPDTILVSMMLVNNELGSVLPVKEAVQIVRRSGAPALFHCDAVQASSEGAVYT